MSTGKEDRQYWLNTMVKISKPVLQALSEKRLKASMPIESLNGSQRDRIQYAHLEALARTLTGIAPWLDCRTADEQEEALRTEFCDLARKAIDSATDKDSPDYVNFGMGFQPIVDAAFLCHAILRSPNALWHKLDERVKRNVISGLKATRSRKPGYNNWLLFSAMIETALYKMGEDWDPMRIDYALRQHENWYQGDGIYGDGPQFHWDYYNSFVIQPMLVDIITAVSDNYPEWDALKPAILQRAVRYGEILERLISPEGTFPPIGRSLAYRFGAFQHLSQMALQHKLPEGIYPSQVRSALTAVIQKTLSVPGNFDQNGWLSIGFCGNQNPIAETYISTGSLYLCTGIFLALGLAPADEFWSDEGRPWTALSIWSGKSVKSDHALA